MYGHTRSTHTISGIHRTQRAPYTHIDWCRAKATIQFLGTPNVQCIEKHPVSPLNWVEFEQIHYDFRLLNICCVTCLQSMFSEHGSDQDNREWRFSLCIRHIRIETGTKGKRERVCVRERERMHRRRKKRLYEQEEIWTEKANKRQAQGNDASKLWRNEEHMKWKNKEIYT